MSTPRPQEPRRIITVSEGIGSGKSSVTHIFAFLDAMMANADTIVRETLEPGEPTPGGAARAFGGDLLKQDGSLDRAFLVSRVFGDEGADERVAQLNAITHPLIEAHAWSTLRRTPKGSLAVYDTPLLIEGNHVDRFGVAVIVGTPVEEHVKRLEGRGLAPEDARTHIRVQALS